MSREGPSVGIHWSRSIRGLRFFLLRARSATNAPRSVPASSSKTTVMRCAWKASAGFCSLASPVSS